MLEFMAKGIIALTMAAVFLIVVLIALAGDLLESIAESRRMQTHHARNRDRATWS